MLRLVTLIAMLAWMVALSRCAFGEELPGVLETRLTTTYHSVLSKTVTTEKEAQELVRNEILPLVDTKASARFILGKYWRRADTPQRERFTRALTEILIKTYSAFLLDERTKTAKFEIVRSIPNKTGKMYNIRTKFTVTNPLPVDFVFRLNKAGEWKVVDVKIEGISMVQGFRTSYQSAIQRSNLESVIVSLEKKAGLR